MAATRNIGAFPIGRRRRVAGRLILLCALALIASGCAGVTDLPQGVGVTMVALPGAQASDGRSAGLLHDAVEVEALLPLEPIARSMEAATTTPGKPTAAVMTELAHAELSDEELDDLRGGFVFSAGIFIEFSFDFVAYINGEEERPPVPDDIGDFPGILFKVVDDTAFIVGIDAFTGILSLVQNSLDFQDIRMATIVHATISGGLAAVRGSLIRSQLNFGAAAF